MSKIYIQADGDGLKHIGNFKNGIFFSKRRKSRHFYHKHNGWAVDYLVINQLFTKDLRLIVIKDKDDNCYYSITSSVFKEHKKRINHKPHREQAVVDIQYWTKTNEKPF